MYLVRRTFHTKPGEARRVASLVHKQASAYRDAGHRSEFRIYFNGGTVPGETNVVVLDWTDEALMSPMREGNNLPREALAIGAQARELVESSHIEFLELMTPDKLMDV